MDDTTPGWDDQAERRAAQARAFDRIGARYDDAFPHKDGQIAATSSLVDQLSPGARILDVGCGTGVPTARMLCDAGFSVTGIDISAGMLALARENVPGATFHQVDVLDVDPSLGPFDAVVAFFSLLMLRRADIPQALRRLGGVLPAKGQLILAMVEADMDDVPMSFVADTVRVTGYRRDDLIRVVESNGFAVEEVSDHAYAPADAGVPPEVQLFVRARIR